MLLQKKNFCAYYAYIIGTVAKLSLSNVTYNVRISFSSLRMHSCLSYRVFVRTKSDSSTKAATLGSISEMNVAYGGQSGAPFAHDILLHEMREA